MCCCYNLVTPSEWEFSSVNPDVQPQMCLPKSRVRGAACPLLLFTFPQCRQLPLPPPSFPARVFPLCQLLPVSQRLLLSPWPCEQAGHVPAEWEEGSAINGIPRCLHKHAERTHSWKVSSSPGGQTQQEVIITESLLTNEVLLLWKNSRVFPWILLIFQISLKALILSKKPTYKPTEHTWFLSRTQFG